jgi:ribosomal protein S27AE
MAYKKVAEENRVCACCGTAFIAAHRRRIYCSNSCNTRACVARKAAKAQLVAAAEPAVSNGLTSPASAADTPNAGTTPVTLAHNLQNWTILSIAPQVPKLVGAVVQFVGELLAPRGAGPTTWLPAALQQPKAPLVAMEHESWDEPRFFVELPHGNHTLYYRAQHELLLVREPTGNLRQLRTAAEFAALTPAPLVGIAALQAQYTPPTISALSAPLQTPLLSVFEPTTAPK